MNKKRFRTTLLAITIACYLFFQLVSFIFPKTFKLWNAQAHDIYFQLRSKNKENLKKDPRIVHLDINDYSYNKLQRILFSKQNVMLQELYLEHNKLEDGSITGWEFLLDIARIDLRDNRIKTIPRELISEKTIDVEI